MKKLHTRFHFFRIVERTNEPNRTMELESKENDKEDDDSEKLSKHEIDQRNQWSWKCQHKGIIVGRIKSIWYRPNHYDKWIEEENDGVDEPCKFFFTQYYEHNRPFGEKRTGFRYPSIIHPNSMAYKAPPGYYTKSAKRANV